MLESVHQNTCTFKDGSQKNVDAIILCTGYQHHFPFLPDELKLKTGNRLWPLRLYKGVVWENNPKLFYLGMQDQYYTFNMFDAQAWYVRDVIMDRITLPAKEIRVAETLAWRERELNLPDVNAGIYFQGDYVKDLVACTDYPTFDVDAVNELFVKWKLHKHEDIMNYRDQAYQSVITGNMQPKHHTRWITALDDSMASYLNSTQQNEKVA